MKKLSVRLSPDVLPARYEITLKPDLTAFTFAGTEIIHLSLRKAARAITLHAKELEIDAVVARTDAGDQFATSITYDDAAETSTFHFAKPVAKGQARLHITFHGILNDKMRGFYRSTFEHAGKTHVIATTQFESTDARRAIPCFDEPAMKAIFDVTLVVPKDKAAISNTIPVEESEADGYKTLRFSPTPPMSTYLLAFIVGDFEYIEKKSADGVLVRIFTTPGKKAQARFALDCAAKTITYFNKYFAIPYPLPVLDMIAIPDFAAGAMENWGAITYRESALLVDDKNSSTMNKQWVALVIAHEIAHQWFGNLVTMEWWTHLWLNEGFASYIEYLAVDKLFPSWDMWTQFLVADMRPALHLDALLHTHPIEVEVHHPSEIAAVFDAVSYSKGASVIRMLAEYVGERDFRDGLRYYLKKHAHGNTVTEDLWRALEHVSGKPVEKMMQKWTGAGGYPLVSVNEKAGDLTISQSRFFSSPLSAKKNTEHTTWQVPISLATEKGRTKEPLLLTAKSTRIKKPKAQWVKINADESGFFRTTYSPALRAALAQAAAMKTLKTRDRLGLVRDVFALADNGTIEAHEAIAFASHYTRETAYVAWAEIAGSLATMHSLLAHEPFLPEFEKAALQLYVEIGKKMTWSAKPKGHADALLKVLVLGSLGKYGDASARTHAAKLLKSVRGEKNPIPADLRGVVYSITARYGGAAEYKTLLAMYQRATLHEEKNRIGAALGSFRDAALIQKTLDFALSDAVRLQDKTRMIGITAMNPAGTALAWKFVQKHWKHFQEKYSGSRELAHLIEPLRVSSDVKLAAEIKAFLKKHPTPGTERTVEQTVEQIHANALWLKRNRASLAKYLEA
jgi:puromycin-sensitive aminopeptidase